MLEDIREVQRFNPTEELAKVLEKLTLNVQKMLKEQINMAQNILTLGHDNINLRNRVSVLEGKSHVNSAGSGDSGSDVLPTQ